MENRKGRQLTVTMLSPDPACVYSAGQSDMAGSGANTVRLSKLNPLLGSGRKPTGGSLLNPSYLSGLATQPPPLAITSGACQESYSANTNRKRTDYNGGYSGLGNTV